MYKSFEKIENSDHLRFSLKEDEWENVLDYLNQHAISCYIRDDEMDKFLSKTDDEKRNYLKKYVLPDAGNIKSGDFGEIFTFYFLIEKFKEENKLLIGLKKWMWKDQKNKPAPCSDVVLCHINPDLKPRYNDILISAEAKMCATKPSRNDNRIQDAIDGADNDRITRLAKSIVWFESKYERYGLTKKAQIVKRFNDPVNNPYKKEFYAVPIIDIQYIDDQLARGYRKESELIKLYLITFNDLQVVYEKYFDGILNGN